MNTDPTSAAQGRVHGDPLVIVGQGQGRTLEMIDAVTATVTAIGNPYTDKRFRSALAPVQQTWMTGDHHGLKVSIIAIGNVIAQAILIVSMKAGRS